MQEKWTGKSNMNQKSYTETVVVISAQNSQSKTRITKAEKLSTRRLLSTKIAVITRRNATKAATMVHIHSTQMASSSRSIDARKKQIDKITKLLRQTK